MCNGCVVTTFTREISLMCNGCVVKTFTREISLMCNGCVVKTFTREISLMCNGCVVKTFTREISLMCNDCVVKTFTREISLMCYGPKWSVVRSNPPKVNVVSLSKKLFPYFLVLVGSRNGFELSLHNQNCLFHTRTIIN